MFLGLDLGTTNIKAALADAAGRVIARAAQPVAVRHPAADAVEQDLEEIYAGTLAAIRGLAGQRRLNDVRAVGVSSQAGAMQVLDGGGRPIGPVISWMDGRGRPFNKAFTAEVGPDWLVAHAGRDCAGIGIGQMLRLRREQPGLLDPPHRVGFVGDAVVARLCGRAAHDATSLSIAMLYNPALGKADPELLARLGIDESRLPDLLDPRTAAGPLKSEVAESVGLPAGIPVSAAVHDQYAAALGVGAVAAGRTMFGAGTAWVLLAITDRLTGPAAPGAFVCTHLIDGLFGQLLSLGNGGSAINWAVKLLGLGSNRPAAVDALIEPVRPGSDGLTFWPLLTGYGGAGLAAGVRARLAGLRLEHTPAHVLRAVVEGLCLELARYVRFMQARQGPVPNFPEGDVGEQAGGVKIEKLLMCGGAAASRVTPQIVADATGLQVACTADSEVSVRGAAVLARGLVEPDKSLVELAGAMTPEFGVFDPGPDAAVYRRLVDEYIASLPEADR